MDCRTFHKNLEDYLEGGLDFPGRFGMERHARQCFGCGKVVADAQQLSRLAHELRGTGAPANFEAELLRRIQKEGLTRPLWKFWRLPVYFFEWPSWRLLTASASILVIAGFAIFFSNRWMKTDRTGDLAVAHDPSPGLGSQRHAETMPAAPTFNPSKTGAVSERQRKAPVRDVFARPRPTYSTDGDSPFYAERADSDYAEYLVPGPGNRQYVMRLPKTIRMLYGQPSEEYFIRNVSH
jgi:hypothetical protein